MLAIFQVIDNQNGQLLTQQHKYKIFPSSQKVLLDSTDMYHQGGYENTILYHHIFLLLPQNGDQVYWDKLKPRSYNGPTYTTKICTWKQKVYHCGHCGPHLALPHPYNNNLPCEVYVYWPQWLNLPFLHTPLDPGNHVLSITSIQRDSKKHRRGANIALVYKAMSFPGQHKTKTQLF